MTIAKTHDKQHASTKKIKHSIAKTKPLKTGKSRLQNRRHRKSISPAIDSDRSTEDGYDLFNLVAEPEVDDRRLVLVHRRMSAPVWTD